MATTRSAHTVWKGDLFTGSGQTSLDTSGLGTYDVTWDARAEKAEGKTSPEELLAAAHATCYSMQFSNMLKENRVFGTRRVDCGVAGRSRSCPTRVGRPESRAARQGSKGTIRWSHVIFLWLY
jgi:organic hydroperoxide reductase OsmC/OhrA